MNVNAISTTIMYGTVINAVVKIITVVTVNVNAINTIMKKKTIINANVRNAIMINVLVRNKSSLNSFRYNLLLQR